MKIAICGKGGSGKSTVVAVLAKELQKRGRSVIVIDSDESNSGLHWMLGMDAPPAPLMAFAGGKKSVKDKMMADYTADGGELDLSIWQQEAIRMDHLPKAHVAGQNGCRLVVTGKIDRSFEGCACPMGVVVKEFLKKLEMEKDEIALVDMEAGVEHFGRGIEASLDAVVAVVEPSLESINLAEKTQSLAKDGGVAFAGAVVNKVGSDQTLAFLKDDLKKRKIRFLGSLRHHARIVENGLKGLPVDLGENAFESAGIVDHLLNA